MSVTVEPAPAREANSTHSRLVTNSNVGLTSQSAAARGYMSEALRRCQAGETLVPTGVLDKIIDMPVGYRTVLTPSLAYIPLGIFVWCLQDRLWKRFRSDDMLGNFVFTGDIISFENDSNSGKGVSPWVKPTNETGERPQSLLHPSRLDQRVFLRTAHTVPLSYIQLQWFMKQDPSDVISCDDFGGLSFDSEQFTLKQYMLAQTLQNGGSDAAFWVMGSNFSIMKRYQNFYNEGYGNFQGSRIRTGALRQVFVFPIHMEFNFYGLPFHMYCPDGANDQDGNFGNCVLKSLTWFMHKKESLFPIEQIIRKTISKRAMLTKRDVKEYAKFYKHGFPTVELNSLAQILFDDHRILLSLWYRKSNQEYTNRIQIKTDFNWKYPYTPVCLFQVRDNGRVLDFSEPNPHNKLMEEQPDMPEIGLMIHAIAIYPYPNCFPIDNKPRTSKQMAREFVTELNKHIEPAVQNCYLQNKYWKDITSNDIQNLVKFQQQRYKVFETSTLIFSDEKKEERVTSKRNSTLELKRKRYRSSEELFTVDDPNAPYWQILAYDLETVNNSSVAQSMVWPPFQNEDLSNEGLEPGTTQIPFSAQWMAVNCSDQGSFLEDKILHDPDLVNTYEADPDVDIQYKHMFLSTARTCYGNKYLGACIEEMLMQMANWVHNRKSKAALCFAHNGAAFDAYMILLFSRFEIVRILKTTRGIMNLSLRVPISYGNQDPLQFRYSELDPDIPTIMLNFRDTILQVPGSLARLCKGFDVPKEFCKLDYPIYMINSSNCYHPTIESQLRDYGENDVKALAVIIHKINLLIGNSIWKPASIYNLKPPIGQFLTCMSMIRRSTFNHFKTILPINHHPRAVDIPGLRQWLIRATIGGRVTPYAKSYINTYLPEIVDAFLKDDTERLKEIHKEIIEKKKSMQCLDVTSLYPFTMYSCPMPTGNIYTMSMEQCKQAIDSIYCELCERLRTLCPTHRHSLQNHQNMRPFAIIIVKDLKFTKKDTLQNFCPRKLFLKSSETNTSLVYSLEDPEDIQSRKRNLEYCHETQSFTNIDLYWMQKQGATFTIVGGFGFYVSSIYNSYIGPAFQKRIEAKQAGNKLLSDFMKLNYNGSFGVTTQQDITDTFFLVSGIPDRLNRRNPKDPEMTDFLYNKMASSNPNHKKESGVCTTEELTGEAVYLNSGQAVFQKRKKPHLFEFFADQSPMQIGAAVLSWARHVMNLIMFSLPVEEITYTDTDSITVSDLYIQNYLSHLIDNSDTAAMGTLKNDHAENNGKEPRIVFSMIGARKVKHHMTLNEKGELKIFNTFKGLHLAQQRDGDGLKLNPDYLEKISTDILWQIFYLGSPAESVRVQSWTRNMQTGVSISTHDQSFNSSTYLGDFKGTLVSERHHGLVESCIPFGSTIEPTYSIIKDPETFEYRYDEQRIWDMNTKFFKGDLDDNKMTDFFEKFFEQCPELYNDDNEEYQRILSSITAVNEEIE